MLEELMRKLGVRPNEWFEYKGERVYLNKWGLYGENHQERKKLLAELVAEHKADIDNRVFVPKGREGYWSIDAFGKCVRFKERPKNAVLHWVNTELGNCFREEVKDVDAIARVVRKWWDIDTGLKIGDKYYVYGLRMNNLEHRHWNNTMEDFVNYHFGNLQNPPLE